MIDWFTVVLPFPHRPINGGCIVASDQHGEMDFKSDRKLPYRSSHDNVVMIRSSGAISYDGWWSELWIDGNISKWLQGHNLVGSDDGPQLLLDFLAHAVPDLGIEFHPNLCKPSSRAPCPGEPLWRHQVANGNFICKRLDITYSYKMASNQEVSEYIEFLADTTRTKFTRATAHGDSTVYWNKKSTHWSMKAYNKHREITKGKGKSHKLPDHWPVQIKAALHDLMEPYLRWELVMRSRKLKEIAISKGYDDAYWYAFFVSKKNDKFYSPEAEEFRPSAMFQEFMDKIQVNDMSEYSIDTAIEKLSHQAYGTYAAWQNGFNVRKTVSRATYYRHKREILAALGVDITLNPHEVKRHEGTKTRVFRMVRQSDQVLSEQINQLLNYVA